MHNLDVDERSIQITVYNYKDEAIHLRPNKKRGSIRQSVKLLCFVILEQLDEHMSKNLGITVELPD
jgi:hypothetical protein